MLSAPPLSDRYTLYPLTPPLSVDAVHVTATCEATVFADTPVGTLGAVVSGVFRHAAAEGAEVRADVSMAVTVKQ